ncbi:GerAB/ArcD/ProY family transporter [Bacillus anthracis]|uniref:GerAB/ArcD/ProY family transporter n=1 Tax=Bacillus anthracis TaxID=1392 RepID=UPI00099C7A78|nr:endospore germination permease [Bacillus anthracis]OPD54074.1 spore gernimation protein [Bacillus anthracis]
MTKQIISFFQLSLVFISNIGMINHVIIIPMLLDHSGRDSWISIIFSSALFLIWISLLFYIHKNTECKHIFTFFKNQFGKIVIYPLYGLLVIYLTSLNVVILKETLTFFSFYLPETPHIVIGILFSIICFYNAQGGIRSIVLTAGILIPTVILLGCFVMIANISHKDYSLLKPILEHGINPVFKGMIYPGVGFIELILFLFVQQYIGSQVKFYQLVIVGIIVIGITIGPAMASIVEFGPFEAANQRYPAFEEWRLVSIGKYIEHLDFLSVYQWLVGGFIHISFNLFLIPDMLRIKKNKVRNKIIFLVLICIVVICTLPISDPDFYWFLSCVFAPMSVITIFIFSILLFILVHFVKIRNRAMG